MKRTITLKKMLEFSAGILIGSALIYPFINPIAALSQLIGDLIAVWATWFLISEKVV